MNRMLTKAAVSRLARFVSATILFLSAATAQEAFEVASIRPTDPDVPRVVWLTYPGGRVVITNYTVMMLIEQAYGLSLYRIKGAPHWADSDFYSITAKPPAGSPAAAFAPLEPESHHPPAEGLAMMRRLLADRFGLKLHRETRELPVYALVIAPRGPKFQRTRDPSAENKGSLLRGVIRGENRKTSWLIDVLERRFRGTILDQTGLTDNYDFDLKFDPRAPLEATIDDSGLTPFTKTLDEQLGLRLKAIKAPVEILVIDEVKRPTPN
jgi:uncharacterized protein (TIGR03435 family)